MRLIWSVSALADLGRLHAFLAPKNESAADRAIISIVLGVERLLESPRIGLRVEKYAQREVRRLIVRAYEVTYELGDDTLEVVRVFHTREDR